MSSSEILDNFIESLASCYELDSKLTVKLADSYPLTSKNTTEIEVKALGETNYLTFGMYDLILANLPIGLGTSKLEIDGKSLRARDNWCELYRILHALSPEGLCLAILEPGGFSVANGYSFLTALASEGFFLRALIDPPNHILAHTSVKPVVAVISKSPGHGLFVASLFEKYQAVEVAHRLSASKSSDSLSEGMIIQPDKFKGFRQLEAKIKLKQLENQFSEYESFHLSEIAEEVNTVARNEKFSPRENAVYIPKRNLLAVADDLDDVTGGHECMFQVVLTTRANNKYVKAFFMSELGQLVLDSLRTGSAFPVINKKNILEAQVSLPDRKEQDIIAQSISKLDKLTMEISSFQKELAISPFAAHSITEHVEKMLEVVGRLTESDQVMSLIREGESYRVEFKETFSLDVRTRKKEKFIELSALKTIVGFLNSDGGVLLIGVEDEGSVSGIADEVVKLHRGNYDKYLLHFKNQVKSRIGEQYYPFIEQKLLQVANQRILLVRCEPSKAPCYLDGKDFYVRTNPATDKLEGPDLVAYVQNRF